MSYDNKNVSTTNPVVRRTATLMLVLAALCASPAALAVDSGDIVVVSSKGEVHFTMGGVARAVRAGGVLELPATLRTGRDGAVELRQGATTVSVGPETLLEFPTLEKRGAPIDRILQPRGNAFYNIGKRDGRKLRIETPYLVGVIKGTQFNVAALDESTTISLFEGLLEVRATGDSDVVDLKAGEIASRKRGDKSISVMKMDGGRAPTAAPRPASGSGSNNAPPNPTPRGPTPLTDGHDSVLVDHSGGASSVVPRVVDVVNGTEAAVGASAAANVAGENVNAAVNGGATGVDIATGTRVDAGPVTVDTGAAVNVGGGSVDVSTSTNVSAGPVSVDTAAAVNVGGGVDVTAGAAVDAGPVAVDTGVDAGPLTTDAGTATAVDLGAGSVDTGVTVGASAPQVSVDVGSNVAADVVAGTVNVGLEIAGADLDLGLDLGLDNDDTTPDTGGTSTDTGTDAGNTTTVVDVGGLLDGLLRRPGRR